ncbi:MAG: hypothetical protein AAB452_02105 [Patescibacteria group bacterium]
MASTKIINVVRDDPFDEIFDLFKNASAEEVIFILPKKAKAFINEEQFKQIQTTAREQEKKVSLMSSNADVIALARQYNFEVLQDKVDSSVKPKRKAIKAGPVSVLAVADEDEIVREDSDLLDPLNPSDGIMGINDSDKEEEITPPIKEEDENLFENKEDSEDELEEELEREDEKGEDSELKEDVGDDADLVSYENPTEPVASFARVRRLDGMVPTDGEGQSIRIHSTGDATIKLGVKKEKISQKNVEDIAEVWQHEPFSRGESMWTGILNKKENIQPSLWARIFSRSAAFQLEKPGRRQEIKPNRSRKIIASITIVILLIVGGVVYATAGTAIVTIIPFSKHLDFEMSANASDQFASVDGTFSKLPGQLFTIEKTVMQEFSATGQRDVAQKARGKITVYNTFSNAPQTLIATTRFESSDALIFRTLRTVTVAGMTGSTPGSVEVEVIADKVGDTYNIPAGRFTIPAFKEKGDTARYQKFYGQSKEAMKDGISGVAKVVTEQDFTKAKETVTQKLKDEIKEALGQEASGLKIADSAPITILSTDSSVQADQPADIFTVTVKGRLKTIGFKEEDVWALVRQYAEKNFGLTVVPDKIALDYKEANLNEVRSTLELTLKLSGNGYGQIDTDQITNDLLGKGERDIVGYLKQAQGVAEAKVILSPFWVKKVPKNKEKITIIIDYQ